MKSYSLLYLSIQFISSFNLLRLLIACAAFFGTSVSHADSGSGSYLLPTISNPDERDCSVPSSDAPKAHFTSASFNGSGATVSIDIVDADAIPVADRYEVQYIDDNFFAADASWTSLPLALSSIVSGGTYQFDDSGYQVEAHRYYRFVAIDQAGGIVYKTSQMFGGGIASVLKHQEWNMDFQHFFTYSDSESYHPGSSYETNFVRYTYPDSMGRYYYFKYGGQTTIYESSSLVPVYSSNVVMNTPMMWTGSTGLSEDYYQVATTIRKTGMFTEIDRNQNQQFSASDSTYLEQGLGRESGDISLKSISISPYPYDITFSDFRGELSLTENPYLNPLDESSEVRLDAYLVARSNFVSYAPSSTDTFTFGEIEITWSDSHLNVVGYDPKTKQIGRISSPYVIKPTKNRRLYPDDPDSLNVIDVSGSEAWVITPQSWPSSNETQINFKVTFPDKSIAIDKSYTIQFPDRVTAKVSSTPDYFNIPFNTATGPRYRKIGLNGRPLSDEKPQAASENDEAKEETYVDAFNLNLVHSVTDIYVPIQGSELALSLRRNVNSEIWSENNGLRPHERPDQPFGPAWSSSACANIKVITPVGPDVKGYEEPVRALVTDENGQTHEFVKFGTAWFPMPSASHEARSYLTELTETSDHFQFKQKHGNVLEYDKITGQQALMRDRVIASLNYTIYQYARLDTVEDRLGYKLKYTYSGSQSLIPNTIAALNPNGVAIPNLEINLSQSGGRVDKAWDPNDNEIRYDYGDPNTYSYASVDGSTTESLEKLILVEFMQDGVVLSDTEYAYDISTEDAYTPLNNSDVWSGFGSGRGIPKPPPYLDPIPVACDSAGDQQHVNYHHVNLSSITDANDNIYSFTYAYDHSKETYVQNSVTSGYYLQTGNPRYVNSITLPDANTVNFINGNLARRIRISATGDGYQGVSITDKRTNSVVDAEGFETTYNFSGMDVEVLKQFKDSLINSGTYIPETKYKDPRILYYTEMEIIHGDYGAETYTFNKAASLALSESIDLSGNQKEYFYEDDIQVDSAFQNLWPSQIYGKYNDPTTETHTGTDNLRTTKTFEYDSEFRKMINYIDPELRRTEITLNPVDGRRIAEKVHAPDNSVLQHTSYQYEDAMWPGVVTTQTLKALNSATTGAADIVTTSQLDPATGRVAASYQYPDVDASEPAVSVNPLVSAYTYDANNNRLSVSTGSSSNSGHLSIDSAGEVNVPNGKTTSFEYDARNRLIKTIFNDSSDTHNYYDARGNLTVQIDENNHATVNQYDTLNRLEKTIRIIGSNYPTGPPAANYTPDADDLVTTNTYNAVNSLKQSSSTDGPTTTLDYDGLQRLRKSTLSGSDFADQVTEFHYGRNSGGSVFNVSGFKPTLSIDPRGFKTQVTYDSLYRPTITKVEYDSGQFATTETVYDKVGNPITVTDPLGQVTSTTHDALNRPTLITFADSTTVSTQYSTTGLPYSVTDQEGNTTTTTYDAAGRPIKVTQPQVSVYGSVAASPVTRTFYDAYGNAEKTVNPLGEEWITRYDTRNRPDRVTQPATAYIDEAGALQSAFASFTETSYDHVGNVRSVTDARGNTSYTVYDEANRPIISILPQVTLAGGSSVYPATQSTYDRAGNILTVKQSTVANPSIEAPLFNETGARSTATNTYDALGRLLSTTDAESITVSNEYDQGNNLQKVTDGEAQITTYEYDGLNRLRTTTYGGSGGDTTTLEYDAVNQTRRIDAIGKTTTYEYDDLHRLFTVRYIAADTENRSYTYDSAGNILTVTEPGKGGLTDVAYTYDDLYRIIEETSNGITHQYQYDLAGNRRQTIYDFGGINARPMTATYDALNRTENIIENGRTSSYRYDLAGNIREKGQGNGDTVLKTYDALGRTATVTGPGASGSELYACTNAYDLYGNLATMLEAYPGGQLTGRTVTNSYDNINRLTTETILKGAETTVTTYDYDDAHNRTSKAVAVDSILTVNETYSYAGNLKNQVQSYTDSISGKNVSFTYDENGNRSKRTEGTQTTLYDYDRENRLVQLTESDSAIIEPKHFEIYPGPNTNRAEFLTQGTYYTSAPDRTYTYAYDYRTRRVVRDESAANGSSTKVVFSGGTSVQEYDDSATTPTVEYIRGSDYGGGIGGILYTLRSGAPSFKHYNSRGDVVAATDSIGALTYQAAYEAFGKHDSSLKTHVHWEFDEISGNVLNDSSGNDRHVTATNTSRVPGYQGNALDFNGSSSYVQIDAGYLEAAFTEHSYSFWFKADDANANNQILFEEGGGTNGIAVRLNNGALEGVVRRNSTTALEVSISFTDTTLWHHLVLVFKADNLELYLDGALVDSDTGVFPDVPLHTSYTGIGGRYNDSDAFSNSGTGGYYNGQIDEFSIYDYALISSEVSSIKENGPNTYSPTQEWGSTLDRQQANTKDEDPTGLLNEGFRYRDLETGTFITRDPLGFVDGPNVYTYVVQNPWTMFDPLGLNRMTPGKTAAHNRARAQWKADGGWAQVPAAAWSGTSRGVVNVSAGIGWLGATSASGYEQMILGTNHSGEFASALMGEAQAKNDGISQTVAGTTGVSVDGAAFKSVEQVTEFVTETALPVGALNKANQLRNAGTEVTESAISGLNKSQAATLKDKLMDIPNVTDVKAFGSRVKGTNRPDSDLDILLEGPQSKTELLKLEARKPVREAQRYAREQGIPKLDLNAGSAKDWKKISKDSENFDANKGPMVIEDLD